MRRSYTFDPSRIRPSTGPLAELDAMTRDLAARTDAVSKRLREFEAEIYGRR